MSTKTMAKASHKPSRAALIGWRFLALFYDAWPVLALWFAVSALFTAGYTFIGHHHPHENITSFSALQWLLWLCCWGVTGLYVTLSWRRGGQTLGMRPWRIKLVTPSDARPSWKALWIRYAIGTLSLLCAGLGFWWAWFDRDRLTWHDRASGTCLQRKPKHGRSN